MARSFILLHSLLPKNQCSVIPSISDENGKTTLSICSIYFFPYNCFCGAEDETQAFMSKANTPPYGVDGGLPGGEL